MIMLLAPYRGAKYKPGFKELASRSINTASNYANDGRDKADCRKQKTRIIKKTDIHAM